jgi:hypothetical protein
MFNFESEFRKGIGNARFRSLTAVFAASREEDRYAAPGTQGRFFRAACKGDAAAHHFRLAVNRTL